MSKHVRAIDNALVWAYKLRVFAHGYRAWYKCLCTNACMPIYVMCQCTLRGTNVCVAKMRGTNACTACVEQVFLFKCLHVLRVWRKDKDHVLRTKTMYYGPCTMDHVLWTMYYGQCTMDHVLRVWSKDKDPDHSPILTNPNPDHRV